MRESRSWPCKAILMSIVLSAVSLTAFAQRGALTIGRNIAELTGEADLIVQANVVSARVEPHPQFKNLMTVLVTLEVTDTLKGSTRKTMQFRQYIWDPRDRLDAARYAKGQELLLLLGPESRYGLRSPVGLEQGRFRITRDATGQIVAVNGKGNAGLFTGVEQSAAAQGRQFSARQASVARAGNSRSLALSDLKDIIRTLANTKASQR